MTWSVAVCHTVLWKKPAPDAKILAMLKPRFDPLRFSPPGGPTQEERRRMIAEAAYHRAELRGFAAGNEVDDWLAAEAEVDQSLSSQSTQHD